MTRYLEVILVLEFSVLVLLVEVVVLRFLFDDDVCAKTTYEESLGQSRAFANKITN